MGLGTCHFRAMSQTTITCRCGDVSLRVTPADGTHGVLYGVEYGDGDSDLKQQFEIVVAHLRGDDGTLGRVWRNAT